MKALSAEKSPVAMKDVKWYTQTCCVGYTVAGACLTSLSASFAAVSETIRIADSPLAFPGIWNNRYYPMTSLVVTANRSAAHDLLISGDSDGYLRLFR